MTTLERRDIDLKMLDYGHAGKRDIKYPQGHRAWHGLSPSSRP